MKKISLIIIIIIITKLSIFSINPTLSESYTVGNYKNWEFVAYDMEINFYFIDPKQIKNEGDGLKLFKELTDFSIPKEEAMSRVSWKVVDCKNFKLKEIIAGFYSLKGGSGKQLDNYLVDFDTVDIWFDVSLPNTVGNLIAEKVCDIK